MLRPDLERAGIPFRDAGGLVFDFHALRCQCATLADAAGVTPRVVQKLMRHSDIRTTMNIYGDVVTADMAEAHGKIVGLALNGTETARDAA